MPIFRVSEEHRLLRPAAVLGAVLVIGTALVGPVPAQAAGTSTYTVSPLQAGGADTFTASPGPDAINGAGLVAGYVGSPEAGTTRAAVFDTRTSTVRELGGLRPGLPSSASAVNIRGDVVGTADISTNRSHAFVVRAGTSTMVDLGVTSVGGIDSGATSINDHGVVAGFMNESPTPDARPDAVTWTLGATTGFSTFDIGRAVGSTNSHAHAVNNGGYVLFERADKGQTWSFVWIPEHRYALQIRPLPGDVQVYASDLNDGGTVVGTSFPLRGGVNRPIVWNSRTRTTRALPVTPGRITSAPNAVNAHGTIVGSELVVKDDHAWSKPVVWTSDGASIRDLPMGSSPTGTVSSINVYGVVVGQRDGTPSDDGRATLWTPAVVPASR